MMGCPRHFIFGRAMGERYTLDTIICIARIHFDKHSDWRFGLADSKDLYKEFDEWRVLRS